jgi:RNA polymerase II-associated factor 1
MLDIPTTPVRYAAPERLEALANDVPFPMIVDAEMGMPLDLSRWACLWEEGGDDSGARLRTPRTGRQALTARAQR